MAPSKDGDGSTSRSGQEAHVIAALATVLSRRFCERAGPRDESLAVGLVRQLGAAADGLMIAAAAATWVAFGNEPEDLPAQTWSTAAAILRDLDSDDATTEVTTFAAAALAVLAAAGRTSQPAHDLVRAGNMARRAEQHTLTAACARAALARVDDLPHDRRVLARIMLAVATRSLDDVESLYADAGELPAGDPIRAIAETLWSSLHSDGRSEHLTAAAEAIMVEDRRAAAASMACMVGELKTQYREDDLLRGLSKAFTALAAPTLDSETLLAALRLLTGHIRDRQRFGELPSPARAGVDMLLSILTIRPGSTEAGAFIELMDGLADAGLDRFLHDEDDERVASRGDSAHAEIAQARIAAHTARDHRRRDSETIIAALHGRTAVIFRERKTLDAPGFFALHLQPPDGVSIKSRAYPTAVSDGLAALAKRSRGVTSDVADQVDADQLVNFLLPAILQDKIRDEGLSQLTVVPDGDLWSVPWRASRLLAGVDVRLMPSLPNAPPPASYPIRSVLAIVDSQAPGADAVITSLHAARDRGTLQITQADDLPTDEHDHDLLLFFGHGAGRGLSYGLLTPRGPRTALDLTRCRNIRQGLLAACWSAGSPQQGSQISVPAALLASGMNPVVGGTWPLPGVETGQVVARAIAHLESAMDLPTAVRRALDKVPVSRDCGWGIAVFGT